MTEKNPKPRVSEDEPGVSGKEESEVSAKKETKREKYVYDGKTPPLNIFLHWCKACNLCIAYCPKKVLEPDRDGKPVLAHPEIMDTVPVNPLASFALPERSAEQTPLLTQQTLELFS